MKNPDLYLLSGYSLTEAKISLESLVTKDIRFRIRNIHEVSMFLSRTLPAFIEGVAMFKPLMTEETVEWSLRKRLLHKTPTPAPGFFREMRAFSYRWACRHLKPLHGHADFMDWIDHVNYNMRRKDQFITLRETTTPQAVFDSVVKMFFKDEFYPERKAPRFISSRDDKAKVWLGPIFHDIESVLYNIKQRGEETVFVKGLTPLERVEKIDRMFGNRDVYVTDYSAFETHFYPEMMRAVEMQVYKVLLYNRPDEMELVKVITGINRCVGRYHSFELPGVRMSGEMNTSVGNGISNFLFMQFACKKAGRRILNMIVEGDDGLVEVDGDIDPAIFRNMGLEIKMAKTKPNIASFCGCVFDAKTRHNFGHPLEALVKFSWTPKKALGYNARRLRELMVAKAYSLCAEYPGVPLIWVVCDLVIHNNPMVRFCRAVKYLDRWHASNMRLTDRVRRPSADDRCFFTELTGITISEQIEIERQLRETYPHMKSPLLLKHMPDAYVESWETYVSPL